MHKLVEDFIRNTMLYLKHRVRYDDVSVTVNIGYSDDIDGKLRVGVNVTANDNWQTLLSYSNRIGRVGVYHSSIVANFASLEEAFEHAITDTWMQVYAEAQSRGEREVRYHAHVLTKLQTGLDDKEHDMLLASSLFAVRIKEALARIAGPLLTYNQARTDDAHVSPDDDTLKRIINQDD